MKLDGNTFKRLQHIINELSAIDLTEDEIIRVAVAGLKAHRHRRKGTTFNSGGNVLTKLKLWFEDVIRK